MFTLPSCHHLIPSLLPSGLPGNSSRARGDLEVKEVKGVMAGDVSPVAMFIINIDYFDLI